MEQHQEGGGGGGLVLRRHVHRDRPVRRKLGHLGGGGGGGGGVRRRRSWWWWQRASASPAQLRRDEQRAVRASRRGMVIGPPYRSACGVQAWASAVLPVMSSWAVHRARSDSRRSTTAASAAEPVVAVVSAHRRGSRRSPGRDGSRGRGDRRRSGCRRRATGPGRGPRWRRGWWRTPTATDRRPAPGTGLPGGSSGDLRGAWPGRWRDRRRRAGSGTRAARRPGGAEWACPTAAEPARREDPGCQLADRLVGSRHQHVDQGDRTESHEPAGREGGG